MKRANIGCGMSPTPEWTNFDNSLSLKLARRPFLTRLLRTLGLLLPEQIEYIEFCRRHDIQWADATRRVPLDDGSVDVVYASHMLEHLDRDEAESFLREVRRILVKGGVVRIVVPDIRLKVSAYLEHGDADAFIESTYMCIPRARTWAQRIRLAYVGSRHHLWMYDGRSLSGLLEKAGFSNAVTVPPGQTTIAQPGKLDLRERESESVYVEATSL